MFTFDTDKNLIEKNLIELTLLKTYYAIFFHSITLKSNNVVITYESFIH